MKTLITNAWEDIRIDPALGFGYGALLVGAAWLGLWVTDVVFRLIYLGIYLVRLTL